MIRLAVVLTAHLALLLVADTLSAADAQQLRSDYLRGRYAEVIEKLGEQPTSTGEVLLSVRCLDAQGKRDEALAQAEAFLKDGATNADLLAEIARLQFERGELDKSAEAVKRTLALDDDQTLARWLSAELARSRGNLDEALAGYEWFIDYYNDNDQFDRPEDLYYVGLAAAQYARWTRNSSQFQFLVQDLFPDVLKRDQEFWPAELAMAELFAEKYNMAEAAKHLNLAVAINANSADVMALKAAIELDGYQVDAALRTAEQALSINPRHVVAKRLQGQAKLTDFRPEQAIAILQEAVDLNPANQTSLGYLAAAMLAADGEATANTESGEPTRFGKLVAKVEAQHKNPGEFYAALGEGCDIVRKYPDAVKYLQLASEKMPQLISVHGDLGMVLMRLGDEPTAKQVLDESFEADPFNVRVKNTLQVLDVLAQYETIETEHFLVRFDPAKDRLLAVYMARFLEDEVFPKVCQGLDFTPPEKTLIEIFNDAKNTKGHGWFSARMVGLPYIGTVGACAGKMIAMASPESVQEPYNWAHVIRHEFVHVVNLQQTNFNIPHWFTEALAVSYESEQRPPDWNQVLARRLAEDNVFNLDNINYGFIRPKDQDDWTMAYCQAYYYSQFIVQEFGDDALQRMLTAYREYRTTDEILQDLFQVDKEDFERRYREFLQKQIAGVKLASSDQRSFAELVEAAQDKPEDGDAQAELAYVYFQRKALPDARKFALKAIEADKDQPLAKYVLGRLYLTIGDTEKGLAQIEEAANGERFERNSVALLAGLRIKQGKIDDALKYYERGAEQEPATTDWQESILRVYLLKKDNEALVKLIPKLSALKHHDPLLRKKMAEIELQQKNWDEAVRWAYEAIGIRVSDADAHALLAQAYRGQEAWELAAREFEVAGQLRPKTVSWSVEAAQLYAQANKPEKAKAVAKRVLEIEPDNASAQAVLKNESDSP
ncbi:tetratricopeptide repeat protein [Blastopirellula marina]|uniref:Peptidase MA-like domain-containing protein n=1 Tax=Blastopirellula marina TaxID=124 RepID=A0A2S8GEQ0_9BACT|nr:tetratricopeptide repeat protein [Blastopirellula marina]PQO42790.1 hypothetical protein C5Y98_01145 [Blastopirellula marina]PTL46556.1 tetratricopeptide repeat protein [Blastopirellula marina]